jgi:hypothetical protein
MTFMDGMYFREFPVTLQAVPAQGYSFAGWQGAITSDQAALTLHLDAAIQLHAIFTKNSSVTAEGSAN